MNQPGDTTVTSGAVSPPIGEEGQANCEADASGERGVQQVQQREEELLDHTDNYSDEDDDDSDDDVTVIVLEHDADDDEAVGTGWVDQDSPEMRERRRNVLLRELQRVQRASFIHFMILCLIPTSLLFIVIATVLGEDEECESAATTCEKEARTFINAFTTRCVCDAISVARAEP